MSPKRFQVVLGELLVAPQPLQRDVVLVLAQVGLRLGPEALPVHAGGDLRQVHQVRVVEGVLEVGVDRVLSRPLHEAHESAQPKPHDLEHREGDVDPPLVAGDLVEQLRSARRPRGWSSWAAAPRRWPAPSRGPVPRRRRRPPTGPAGGAERAGRSAWRPRRGRAPRRAGPPGVPGSRCVVLGDQLRPLVAFAPASRPAAGGHGRGRCRGSSRRRPPAARSAVDSRSSRAGSSSKA